MYIARNNNNKINKYARAQRHKHEQKQTFISKKLKNCRLQKLFNYYDSGE